MGHRRRSADEDDEVAALAAVWGREASATAAPHERPTIPPPATDRRPGARLPLLVAGATVVAVLAIVAAVVVVVTGDDPATEDRATDPRDATTATTTTPEWEPGWTMPVACPRLEVTPELRTSACPVATDEQHVYVLAVPDEVPTLVARSVETGEETWAAPLPGGAIDVRRDPSVVLVQASDVVHAIDPDTGEARWTLPGFALDPLGREHVLLDHLVGRADGGTDTTMSVVEVATGAVAFSVSGPRDALHAHPCGAADLVLVSAGDRLIAREVADGAERWAVDAPHHGAFDPVVCSDQVVVAAEPDGVLVARDVRTGAEVGRLVTTIDGDAGLPSILDAVGGTVVVQSSRGLAGHAADPTLEPLWALDLPGGGREATIGAGGEGVAVVVPGDRAAWFGPMGGLAEEVPLGGRDAAVVEAGRLVVWGPDDVLVATAVDLDRTRTLELADVRRAAATPTHVVVTTRDEVRLYPFDP